MKQKECKPLPEKHLWQLALHTGQWCRAVLCQAHRFFDALEADNRPLPWDDSESFDMFLADKTFLITAIHHSIVNMEKLNAELINRQLSGCSGFDSNRGGAKANPYLEEHE